MNSNPNMGHFKNALTVMSVVAIPFIGKMPAVSDARHMGCTS